ncbi:alpha/beta hydrolase [Microbacterium sp. NPDC089695]|uniref:alpha/beta hydrolase n=1 Tax=Microbacterium sp. NPDC089695 TaxID=3364198 RepID=UPI0037F5697A
MPSGRKNPSSRPVSRVALAAIGVVASLLAAGCAAAEAEPADDPLASFYAQDLAFGECAEYATTGDQEALFVEPLECARLTVPLDYDDPEGATAEIAVMRLVTAGENRIGSMVINPGGPGGSGITQLAQTVAPAFVGGDIAERFDLVGFDPRGVGASTPTIGCFTPEQRDAGDDRTVLAGTAGLWGEDDTEDLHAQCADGSGGDEALAHMGTRDVVRDLDILRAALGDEQLTFAGQSYGTRIGALYAETFPENVRAMILDGALDSRLGTVDRRILQFTGFQRSFDLFAAYCAEQTGCPLGDDPAAATTRFQDIVRPLIDEPAAAGATVLTYDHAVGAVTGALYDELNWPILVDGLTALEAGDGVLLRTVYDYLNGRSLSDGSWSNQWDANFVVNCNDEERRSPSEEADLRAQVAEVAPFLDSGQDIRDRTRDGCEHWPAGPSLTIPYAQDVEGLDTPPLVLSITGDPATPYESGVAMAEDLGGALFTVEAEQHTVFQAGTNECVMTVTAAYLIDLTVPDDDARCVV